VLSGGERGRLALAKLALSDANLLLLDEPTNHLDIPAQEVLQNVMADFDGTIILVSHDRYLIDALGTQIWEINPEESRLVVFQGTYSEYRAYQDAQGNQKTLMQETLSKAGVSYQANRAAKNRALTKERRRRARLEEVETRVAELETQLEIISEKLANPPENSNEVIRLGDDYVEIQNELEALIVEWEQLHS
jgi:ATP-binding cassette subfamily F protein 3